MNPEICPAILAVTADQYRAEMAKVSGFASRIQIDLSDGKFAPHQTIAADEIWWPVGVRADIHLMFEDPQQVLERVIQHKPNLVILHAEADWNHKKVAKFCRTNEVKLGVALLPDTSVELARPMLELADHALIFSGSLGEYGGHANLTLLDKVQQIRSLKPEIEIGWDGGINDQNVAYLAAGGVNVLNVGGFLQHSPDPKRTFDALQRIADETGTT